jgi:CBS domain-containing protein
MTTEVVYVMPDAPVSRIARLMQDKAISGIPVIDDERRVVGMVTDLDLIVRNTRLEPPAFVPILDGRIPLETPGHYKKRLQHMLGTKARDVMTEDVVTIGPDEEVETLAALMVKRLVFCFDGSWNGSDSECQTNVVITAESTSTYCSIGATPMFLEFV